MCRMRILATRERNWGCKKVGETHFSLPVPH